MKRALLALPALLLLAGCAAVPEPTATVTVTAEPAPAPTVTVYETVQPEEPAAPDASTELTFEALGTGSATVTYSSDGTTNQHEVTLPWSTPVEPSIGIGVLAVVHGDGVGCRITGDGEVFDETPAAAGQMSAQCSYDD